MSSSPPKIFNPHARNLAAQRAARRQARTGPSFLYRRAAEDAASRLEDINRRFARAVLIGQVEARHIITESLSADRQPK